MFTLAVAATAAALLAAGASAQTPGGFRSYARSANMGWGSTLYWTYTDSSTPVRFGYVGPENLQGWICVGPSPDGAMPDGDLVLITGSGGSQSGNPGQYTTNGRSSVTRDSQQDITPVAGGTFGTRLYMEWDRDVSAGAGDVALTPDVLQDWIFAFSASTSLNNRHSFASGVRIVLNPPPQPPGPPRQLTVNSRTQTSATITWQAPQDAGDNPILDYSVDTRVAGSGGSWVSGCNGVSALNRFCTVNSLAASTVYEVRIRARSSTGVGAPFITTLRTAGTPGAPPTPALTSATGSQLVLALSATTDDGDSSVTSYEVLVGGAVQASNLMLPADASYTLTTGLGSPGTPVQVTLRAVNGVGPGDESPPLSTRTNAAGAVASGAVQNLTAGAVTPFSVSMSWEAPTQDGGSAITGFVIERRLWTETDADFAPISASPVSSVTYGLTDSSGISPFTDYVYRVTAQNSVGLGAPTVIEITSAASGGTAINTVVPGEYPYSHTMHGGAFTVHWRHERAAGELHVALTSLYTRGWVAMGIGSAMADMDVITGRVDENSGSVTVDDRYSNAQTPPTIDSDRNILDFSGSQIESNQRTTTVKFVRAIDTGDAAQDKVISLTGLTPCSFAYRAENDDFVKHTIAPALVSLPFGLRPGQCYPLCGPGTCNSGTCSCGSGATQASDGSCVCNAGLVQIGAGCQTPPPSTTGLPAPTTGSPPVSTTGTGPVLPPPPPPDSSEILSAATSTQAPHILLATAAAAGVAAAAGAA